LKDLAQRLEVVWLGGLDVEVVDGCSDDVLVEGPIDTRREGAR
jgi:hypothetical protein